MLSLVTQVFSQVTARKYYQSAEAGLDFSFGLGPRYCREGGGHMLHVWTHACICMHVLQLPCAYI